MTSTTKGDNLPLTSFNVEAKPCLDHNDISKAANADFYPLEHDRDNDCREISQFSERYDSRYTDLSIQISEYDVQEASGVLATLRSLPNFSLHVTEESKKNTLYGFWSRATIPWSLECEANNSRDSIVSAAKSEVGKESPDPTLIILLIVLAYGIGFIVTLIVTSCYLCGKCQKSDTNKCRFCCWFVCLVAQLSCYIFVVILASGQKEEL